MTDSEASCKSSLERMLKNSQTKVIASVIAFGLLKDNSASGKTFFADSEIRKAYQAAVKYMKHYLGHDVHIGGKYYDAYGSRMARYGILRPVGHLEYELLPPYPENAGSLCKWIPQRIKQHIEDRLGIVPQLRDPEKRIVLACRSNVNMSG